MGVPRRSGISVNLNVAFNFSNLCNLVIYAVNEIRKQYTVEASVLRSSFVFLILVHYFMYQCLHCVHAIFSVKEKVNKSWQFDFPFKSLLEIGE